MKLLKRLTTLLLVLSMMLILPGCSSSDTPATAGADESGSGNATTGAASADMVVIEKLSIAFIPSLDANEIITTTEPLKELLISELATMGYDVKEVDITVGTSYEAVGESLAAGSVDVGFVGGTVYTTFAGEVDLLLTATRNGLSVTTDDPKDWNTGEPTTNTDLKVTGYPCLIYAGPSEYGQTLAAKVEAGKELTWEDFDGASWAVSNTTSNAGYLYPCYYLNERFGKMISDLSNVVPGTNYNTMFSQAASEQIDVFVSYGDARTDMAEAWTGELGRSESIFDEVKVIGVTEWVINDCVIGSQTSENMKVAGFKEAFTQAMINAAETDKGLEAISIYAHKGYIEGKDSDYDTLREVQKLVK